MNPKPKGKYKKSISRASEKKLERAESEIANGNVSNIRASHYGRHARYSVQTHFVSKTEIEDFQIRKALNVYVREELEQQGRKTYYQRVFILARNIDLENVQESSRDSLHHSSEPKQLDYRECFQKHMEKIFSACELKKFTNAQLTGLFVCMGTYTCLVMEGAEDMMADFFEELTFLHDNLWTASKVFLVEDKIGETYFKGFHTRRSSSINVNEKFPASTSSDKTLMSAQHFKIMEKVKLLAETFANQLHKIENPGQDPHLLPADPFNKLLPEVQRIDLVLNANTFYNSVKNFALTYLLMPPRQDDSQFWPIQENYTPLTIFERSSFDVNLTFGDYGEEEKKNENVIEELTE